VPGPAIVRVTLLSMTGKVGIPTDLPAVITR